ncbi:MAG: metallophosphoesterase [Clostridia bacterium]|nr:metallophosphoesterase [Clostridia bacterium]
MGRSHDPLFDEGKRKHPFIGFIILLLALIIATVAVMNTISNSRVSLLKQSITVPNLPSALENFRILHISDLHGLYFGPHQEQVQAAIASARYDIVCVTGDITGKDGDVGAFLELLKLFGDKPVYFIPGDEDPAALITAPHSGSSPLADYIRAAQSQGAVYLDAPVRIERGKSGVWLCPAWVYTLNYNGALSAYQARLAELQAEEASPERDAALAAVEYQLNQLDRIRQAWSETTENQVHIGMTHVPLQDSVLQALREWTASDNEAHIHSISLMLAGHNVAGQWRLPGIGAVRAPGDGTDGGDWFPEDQKVTGLNSIHGISQYISPGLGTSAAIGLPPIRLFNTPSVTVITLTSKLTF